ncbi:MAG: DMT family transporter ['Candidatus Kapabacteria' thiocyanatum]|uniref:EamA domain-containing protein n=1 Tax=Candidatus Kapaibacterium thiocyanatum TaxID=1895771 RepID=A0A1M3L259_9BACT|nr:DMT family transporter ['Candidatus Kapabacteria' thiocyanatum]OJX59318.1 MAG: hypothetical protein BGO89_02555 ['Candidatus Kapabacteria' thiocyanatum]
MTQRRAEALLLLITCLWGGTFAIIKDALVTTSPAVFVLLRFGLALVMAIAIWPRAMRGWNRRLVMRGMALGSLYGICLLLQSVGLTSISASSSAFITGSAIIFVPFIHRGVTGTSIRPRHLVAAVIVVVGLWLLTEASMGGFRIGDIVTLISALLWAFYLTYIDVWTSELRDDPDKQNALVIMQFGMTVILAGITELILEGGAFRFTWNTSIVWSLLYCSVVASVLATWVQTRFQQYTHPVRAGMIFAVEPLAASAIAFVAFDESWSMAKVVGAIIMLAGMILPDYLASRRTITTTTS